MVSLPGWPLPSGGAGMDRTRPTETAPQVRRVDETTSTPRQDRDSTPAFVPARQASTVAAFDSSASAAVSAIRGSQVMAPVSGGNALTAHLLGGSDETLPSGIQTTAGASRAYRQHGAQPPLYDSLPVVFRAKA